MPSDSYLDVAEPFLSAFAARSRRHSRAVGAEWQGDIDGEGELEESGVTTGDICEAEEQAAGAEGAGDTVDSRRHFSGLLIFFPGIPGCGKSALSTALTTGGDSGAPENMPFGDGREVDHLMSDMIKGMK